MRKNIFLILISILLIFTVTSLASDYPSKPIDCIVIYNPGGATDMMARVTGSKASEILEQVIIYRNMPGAGGLVGLEYAANSKPDGYTFATLGAGELCSMVLSKDIKFSLDSFDPIAGATNEPTMMIANAEKFKNLDDFIAQAKANPGEFTYASFGAKTTSHLGGELIKLETGIDMIHVPFSGGADALAAVLGGHVDAAVVSAVTAFSNIRAGNVIGLGMASEERFSELPDVPTFIELGYPKVVIPSYNGFVAPKGMPNEIKDKLFSAIEESLNDEGIKKVFIKSGALPDYKNREEWTKMLERDAELIKEVGASVGL